MTVVQHDYSCKNCRLLLSAEQMQSVYNPTEYSVVLVVNCTVQLDKTVFYNVMCEIRSLDNLTLLEKLPIYTKVDKTN